MTRATRRSSRPLLSVRSRPALQYLSQLPAGCFILRIELHGAPEECSCLLQVPEALPQLRELMASSGGSGTG